jgi:hypothetical protein
MISEATRRKMSESHKGKHLSEATRKKMSEMRCDGKSPRLGKHHTEDARRKLSEANCGERNPNYGRCGEKHPMFGKHLSEETRRKIREGNQGKTLSELSRKKLSIARLGRFCGKNSPGWLGGVSFAPYCEKFNNEFKERVRAFFDYQCVECGTPQNGKRLHVHHVNFNKMSCCDGTPPLFVPLCHPCHPKTNHNRDYWEQHFTEIINNYYQGRCYFTKDEMKLKGVA